MAGFPDFTDPTPRSQRRFRPAQGAALSGGGPRPILLIENKATAGIEPTDTLGDWIKDQGDAITRAGRRSPLFWQYMAARLADPQAPIRMIAVPENGAGSPSTRTFTITGNAAVGSNLYCYGPEQNVAGMTTPSAPISAGDTPAVSVSAVVDAINENAYLPYSASIGSAVIGQGFLTSSPASFPVALAVGDTFIGKVDQQSGAATTLTIAAVAATVTGSGATYAAVTAGHSLTLSLNGAPYVVVFTGSEASQANFFTTINAVIAGFGLATDSSGETKLSTTRLGSGATGAVVAGSADVLASLGLSVGAFTAGTGNVANVASVTAAEFAGLLTSNFTGGTAGSTGTANADGSVTWQTITAGASPKGVQFTSGTGVSKIAGFDTAFHGGTAATAQQLVLTTFQLGPRSKFWLDAVWFAFDDAAVGVTISAGAVSAGTGADDLTAALVAADMGEHTYIVIGATATSTVNSSDGGVGAAADYIARSIAPDGGKSQMLIYGVAGSAAQGVAVAQSSVVNSVFCHQETTRKNPWPPCMTAAHKAGILRSEQIAYAAFNFRGYRTDRNLNQVCAFPAPQLVSDRWSATEVKQLLNGGCSALGWTSNGAAFIIHHVTTYSWIGSTATADYRARAGHYPSVIFKFWEDWDSTCTAQGFYKGNIAAHRPKGQKPVEGMVYADAVESAAKALIRAMAGAYQAGKPLLNSDELQDMLALTSMQKVNAGWYVTANLKAVQLNLFNFTDIVESSAPY